MNHLKMVNVVLIVAVAISVVVFAAYAQNLPPIINYSGTLTNSDGTKISGAVDMTFHIYSSAAGGDPLWTESWNAAATPSDPVIVTDGNFNVMVGAHAPLPSTLFTTYPNTFLGITVGAAPEMLPRQRIASVGYSFAAGNGIPKGGIIMWSGSVNEIPEGWALCDGSINGVPDLRDRFVVGAGRGYTIGNMGGEATHVLTIAEMPSHTHIQDPHTHLQNPHNHINGVYSKLLKYTGSETTADTDSTSNEPNIKSYGDMLSTTAVNQYTTATNHNTGGELAHENRPPYFAIAFIIKL